MAARADLGEAVGARPPAAGAAKPDGRTAPWRRVRLGDADPLWLAALLRFDLLAVLGSLYACLEFYEEPLTMSYGALAVVAIVLVGRIITPPELRRTLTFGTVPRLHATRLLAEWATVVGVLLFAGFALKMSEEYSRRVLLTWFAVAPPAVLAAHTLQCQAARWLSRVASLTPTYVIVGVNKVGLELARRLQPTAFQGFFDFRSSGRLQPLGGGDRLIGSCAGVADFVRRHNVSSVYIALPITNAPRIVDLLNSLRDTTATVYFVPDVFAFDLIQARIVDLNGIPGLAICDTPLRGTSALSKRVLDLAVATLGLAVLAPLLLAVAIAVKRSSPGPALFRQRRYGLNGEEITVYKFRTMTVCEDGPEVRQASRHDRRVTRVGRFLRRTSLDELPQLINVVQGTMSLVGPRPHAVAHNEMYRKLISGYMIRHKVRPGITGWAQVHGLRGETDSIDKMERRIHYDLDYLNSWSLWLDVRILVRTLRIVLDDRTAY